MHNLVFVWDNFGFMHDERCEALADALGDRGKVFGLELFSNSSDYGWANASSERFTKLTIFHGGREENRKRFKLAWRIVRACRKVRATHVFMCGHGTGGIFEASTLLRLLGIRVTLLSDSKFDDRPRSVFFELMKYFYYLPYQSALVSSRRSKEYFQFLGMKKKPFEYYYYNRPLARIRSKAGVQPAPAGLAHGDRDFTCVARLIEKKNHGTLLKAYARYAEGRSSPRKLVLCGSGPLEAELREQCAALGIETHVEFRGWQNEDDIAKQLGRTLCLLLPSREEQFGIVVIEAIAMGLPCIVGENVGARDLFLRNGVNGFVIEPDNVEGLACFMTQLADDQALWERMARQSIAMAEEADVSLFVRSTLRLAGLASA